MPNQGAGKAIMGGFLPLLLVLVWLATLRPIFLGGPVSYILVSGASMEPTFYDGDLVILVQADAYQTGDVIGYPVVDEFFGPGPLTVHRIVGKDEKGFITQGDNKSRPDPWLAQPENIVGRMWFSTPAIGRSLAFLRQPLPLGILAGGLGMLLTLGGKQISRQRRRKGRGRGGSNMKPLTLGPRAMVLLGFLLTITVSLGSATVFSFLQPAEKTVLVSEGPDYEHIGTFDYTARVERSTLYPDGLVGPGQAIYTRLARSLDLGFSYRLITDLPVEAIGGDYAAYLQIAVPDGWSKSVDLVSPTPFAGPTFDFRATIEFAPILSLIDAIEKETGYSSGVYNVSISPRVRLSGVVDSEPVEDSFTAAFTMKLGRIQIVPDAKLAQRQVSSQQKPVAEAKRFTILGLIIPVAAARWLSAGGLALAMSALVVFIAIALFGLGKDEVTRIQARYGSMIVTVGQSTLRDDTQQVQVASIQDLVRLSQRDGGMILHQAMMSPAHRYFVYDDKVVYEYTPLENAIKEAEEA